MATEGISNQENMNVQVSNQESVATMKRQRGTNKTYIKKLAGEARNLLQNKKSFDKFDINSLNVTLEEKLSLVKCFGDRIIEFIDDEEEVLHEIETTGEFSRLLTQFCSNILKFFNQRNLL